MFNETCSLVLANLHSDYGTENLIVEHNNDEIHVYSCYFHAPKSNAVSTLKAKVEETLMLESPTKTW